MRLLRNILILLTFIFFLPSLIMSGIGYIIHLPFTLIDKYKEAIAIQEEFEETGRKLIDYYEYKGKGRYIYLKSYNRYKGEIEKIEDNKIYFMVDMKETDINILKLKVHYLKDVEDYLTIIDFSDYDFDFEFGDGDWIERDQLFVSDRLLRLKSIEELKDYIGVQLTIELKVEEIVIEGEQEGKEIIITYVKLDESDSEAYAEEQLGDLLWN